ncbi:MAG TPA: ATP-binding protein [Anaerolineae bacterium]|nr:ATP-binding protein [Anaerolineae bacterium]
MFVDRQAELAFLNSVLERKRPTVAQFVLLYGRRRVGKTVLLRHWAEHMVVPHTYWAAEKEPAALQRRKLFARLLGVEPTRAATFDSWADCWQAIAAFLADRRHILILDEFTYAVESDPAMLSSLQHAWDQQFKDSQVVLVLCGSHVHTMETLQSRQSPLFGRLTGQWWLHPLPFAALQEFLPGWSADERVAGYAVVGGVPAYLEWLDPTLSLSDNVHQVILAPGSMWVAEPTFLLYDEVREPATHLAILKAIGAGNHTLSEISDAALVSKAHLSAYLARLQELRLVERRLPVTIPPAKQRRSRSGRYHMSDPYFRFYFRFLAPNQDELTYHPDLVLPRIRDGLRAFVGMTAFEELSRQWVTEQGRAGKLPLAVQEVGSHWSRAVQVDVVAINWAERAILLGECKWGTGNVDRAVIREMLESKTPKVLKDLPEEGAGWKVHHAFFARTGFTEAARTEALGANAQLVNLTRLDTELRHTLTNLNSR